MMSLIQVSGIRRLSDIISDRSLMMFFGAVLFIAFVVSGLASTTNGEEFRCEGCNIVLVSLDTLRADHMGLYGYNRNTTPNIDRLANKSVVFDRMFVQSFHTTPSTFSTFSSVYPTEDFYYGYEGRSRVENFTMLAEVLQEEGYSTYSVNDGFNVREELGFSQGFDQYKEGMSPTEKQEKIEGVLDSKEDDRFFMYYQSFQTHHPYYASPYSKTFNGTVPGFRDESIQKNKKMGSEDEEEFRDYYFGSIKNNETLKKHAIAEYDSSVFFLDNQVGDILDMLERTGHMEDTVVIITSQHGENFGEHGDWRHENLWNEVIRVPYIMYVPGEKSRRIDNFVEMVDVAPTILDIVGAEDEAFDDQADGGSLLPLLRGEDYSKDFVFSIYLDHAAFIETSTGLKYYRRPEEKLLFNLTEDFEEDKPIENSSKKERMENLFQDVYNQIAGNKYEGEKRTYPYFAGS